MAVGASSAAAGTLRSTVFALYRQFLRAARAKDVDGALGLRTVVVTRFRSSAASIERREFQRIEFMVRDARRPRPK